MCDDKWYTIMGLIGMAVILVVASGLLGLGVWVMKAFLG